MAGIDDTLGHSDSFRRTWDTARFEKMAKEKEKADKDKDSKLGKAGAGASTERELLKRREYKVDLDSKLGKSVVVTKATPQAQSGGYYCNVCDCVVKDSINFLDHINGRKHQRNLGMSMKIERSTLDQVKERFEFNKKRKDEEKKKYDFEQRVRELKEEEEKLKEYRREQKKARKRKEKDEEEDLEAEVDPEMEAMMGFSGFGAKKKKA
ncbi:hypothetical protein EMCRGX_G033972 [Ephydatia muelleri]